MTSRRILARLLQLHDGRPDRVNRPAARIDHMQIRTVDAAAELRDGLMAAERIGAVSLVYGRNGREHLVERVVLHDPDRLAVHLGVERPGSAAIRQAAAVQSAVGCLPEALEGLLGRCRDRWARGQAIWGLKAGDAGTASERFHLLKTLFADRSGGQVSPRFFSVEAGLDSKAFQRHESGLLAMALALRPDLCGLPPSRAWGELGIAPYSHLIYVRGPLQIGREGVWTDARLRPFAGFHPEAWETIKPVGPAAGLLTIENLASFNQYARDTASEDEIVVYLGGFPGPDTLDFLNALLQVFPEMPFLHWGDIDPGGVRIFQHLEANCRRPPVPHLMGLDIAEQHGTAGVADKTLLRTGRLASLAEYLSGERARWVEQEKVPPISIPRQKGV